MAQDFEIGSLKFKVSKISPMKQFHVMRRMGPILADVLPALKNAAKYSTTEKVQALPEDEKWQMVADIAGPAMSGLSQLKDADAELVLMTLLEAVEVQHGGAWTKVSNGGMLMMQNFELPMLLNLAGRAFSFNLSGFFSALPQK